MAHIIPFGVLVAISIVALILVLGAVLIGRHWLRAALHGVILSPFRILAMRLRGNPPFLLIDAYIVLIRRGSSLTMDDIENMLINVRGRISTSDDLVEYAINESPLKQT